MGFALKRVLRVCIRMYSRPINVVRWISGKNTHQQISEVPFQWVRLKEWAHQH